MKKILKYLSFCILMNETLFTLDEYNYCLKFTHQNTIESLQSVTASDARKLLEMVDDVIWYLNREEGKFEYTLCKNKEKLKSFLKMYDDHTPHNLLSKILCEEMKITFKASEIKLTTRDRNCIECQARVDATDLLSCKTLYHILLQRYPDFTDVIQEVFAINYACDRIANQLRNEQLKNL